MTHSVYNAHMQTDAVVSGIPFAAIAMVVWIAAILLCVGLGFVLSYLWYRYAMNKATASLALTIYIAGSCILLFAMFAVGISLPV